MTDRPTTGIVVNVTSRRLKQIIKLSEIWNESLDETIRGIVNDYLNSLDWKRETQAAAHPQMGELITNNATFNL